MQRSGSTEIPPCQAMMGMMRPPMMGMMPPQMMGSSALKPLALVVCLQLQLPAAEKSYSRGKGAPMAKSGGGPMPGSR